MYCKIFFHATDVVGYNIILLYLVIKLQNYPDYKSTEKLDNLSLKEIKQENVNISVYVCVFAFLI